VQNESVGIDETGLAWEALVKVQNESVGIDETGLAYYWEVSDWSDPANETTPSDGEDLVKLHVDNMGLTETAQRLRHLLRSETENVEIAETLLRFRTLLRSQNESLELTEAALKTLSIL